MRLPEVVRRTWLLPLLVVALLSAAGCDSDQKPEPAGISIVSGAEQTGALNQALGKPLQVEVITAPVRGWLGGKGTGNPVKNVRVTFQLMGSRRGAGLRPQAPGASEAPVPAGGTVDIVTDAGGTAVALLTAGGEPGDLQIRAFLPDYPNVKPAIFRATAGVICEGGSQEGRAGSLLENPLRVILSGPDGKPLARVPVCFYVEKGPKGTKLTNPETETDDQGRAETQLLMGEGTGQVVVAAVPSPAGPGPNYRPLHFNLFSLHPAGILIVVIGGLAIFILGMRIMSDSLVHVAGARMKSILQVFTRNPVIGAVVGTGVTAAIQSSSATTVMVVGFVNAGLLSLERAIGLIMGANIGTTVTAQMISFKLDSLALPAVALGVLIQLVAKRKLVKHWGMVLAGFGLLFFGLTTMGGALKGLEHSPTITGFFKSIDCTPRTPGGFMPFGSVLLAVGIGTLVTLVVQSSSASIGLLQVLAATGLLNYYTVIPILLGDNIGTTTTALFASIGSNRNARRAAVAHMLFNCLGTLVMFCLFFVPWDGLPVFLRLVNMVTGGDAFSGENMPRHIANAHTMFNLSATVIFLPLVPILAFLCRRLVPESAQEKEEKPRYLEPHLLNTPTLALDRARSELVYMTKLARKAVEENYRAFAAGSIPNRERLDRREERIDALQHDITAYLVKLSQRDLDEAESAQLPVLMHSVNDAERIGDHAENLLELAERRVERKLPISDDALRELADMHGEVDSMFDHVLSALEKGEPGAVDRALRCETRINEMTKELGQNHVTRLEKGACNLVSGVAFLDMVANLEKVGDHLTNIAEAADKLLPAAAARD